MDINNRNDRGMFELSNCSGYYIPIDSYKEYLKSYDLHNSIEEEILENLEIHEGRFKNKFNSDEFCPICLIKKAVKTRHVKTANLCVKEFQFYSKIFDKIVFYKNFKTYLLVAFLNTVQGMWEIYQVFSLLSSQFTFYPLFYVLEFFMIECSPIIKLILLFNILMCISWFIDLLLALIAVYYGLTIDELMNTHHYPYLFETIGDQVFYNNRQNKGLIGNIKEMLNK